MKSFTITANGADMGTYQASGADAAILAYVQDAGYASVADAADALGTTEEEFLAEIAVSER